MTPKLADIAALERTAIVTQGCRGAVNAGIPTEYGGAIIATDELLNVWTR